MNVRIEREGAVAVVTIDNPPVNALSAVLRRGLLDAAEALDADTSVRAVVLICAGRTFVAGADVQEFDRPPVEPHLPDVINRIERARLPWVAAIHGSALGGGLELALGCRFRLAVPGARLGLPETGLGIVPGAGGCVRLPRLIDPGAAVDLVTGGRVIPAAEALALGLVDALIEDDLRAGSVGFALAAADKPLPRALRDRAPAPLPEAFWQEREAAIARRAKGEIAPLRALACLRRGVEDDFVTASAFERATFLELRGSAQAAALRHVFFAERAAPRPPAMANVPPRQLRTAAVIGGGTMGAGIAAALLDAGLPVKLIERDGDALERGIGHIDAILASAAKRGRLSREDAERQKAAVTGSTDYAILADADLVIEAVFEDLAVKRGVFARLGSVCRVDAVLATNTSYLDPAEVARDLPCQERFLGLHFFSPANVMKLLEIVPTPHTAPDVLATGFALAQMLRKIPVQAGICDGFIGNRILKRYRAAAEILLGEGVGIAAVDAAMRAFGFAMGPFEAQDLGGLDIAFLQRENARAAGRLVPETLADRLVRAGRKGQKSGAGWYDYDPGNRTPRPSVTVEAMLALSPDGGTAHGAFDIAAWLVGEMAAEGQAILAEGVARQSADIDLVLIHGYGFPRWRGGPMYYVAQNPDAAV